MPLTTLHDSLLLKNVCSAHCKLEVVTSNTCFLSWEIHSMLVYRYRIWWRRICVLLGHMGREGVYNSHWEGGRERVLSGTLLLPSLVPLSHSLCLYLTPSSFPPGLFLLLLPRPFSPSFHISTGPQNFNTLPKATSRSRKSSADSEVISLYEMGGTL